MARVIFFRGWKMVSNELVGWRGCYFVRRWAVEAPSGRGVRVHRFLPDVEEFTPHDHPWWFMTFVLRGRYVDVTTRQGGEVTRDEVRAPGYRFRGRGHEHRTITGPDGAWTIVLNGASRRMWGFWPSEGHWMPWRAYHGLGPRAACESPDPDPAATG